MYAGSDSGVASASGAAPVRQSSAIEVRMTTPAATSLPPTCSPTNAQPRKTATAGFTYAYVESSVVEACFSSQP